MRRPTGLVLLAGLVVVFTAGAAAATEPQTATYKVGVTSRRFEPREPYDWRDARTHALATRIWYPAAAGAREEPRRFGPPGRPFFELGRAARDAPLAPAPQRFPLILLSHGSGGVAATLGWLGIALARHGYIAAAVDHPGNNAVDGYTVAGFSLWWLRALDLSRVIDGMLADPGFGPRIDAGRIGAAGHSLGGYTAIAIAGGVTSLDRLRNYCASRPADRDCIAPPSFADYHAKRDAQATRDAQFAAALAGDLQSYRDPRVRAVFAMAPGLGPAFLPESLAAIRIPVAIVAGAGDEMVPIGSNAEVFAAKIPNARLTLLPAPIGHDVFLAECAPAGRAALPTPCSDPPGIDRARVHATTARLALEFFAGHLGH